MALTPGTRLGPYEIVAPLGAGGMGEVYRARDTRLGRDVAIKVLPEDVASDPDRLARFEREAKAVAALNHPNIVTLHSIEEADGVRFLTMELVEGQSLDRCWPARSAAGARARPRDPARRRAGRGAREGRRAPRPEARERDGDARGPGQGARLRARQARAEGSPAPDAHAGR